MGITRLQDEGEITAKESKKVPCYELVQTIFETIINSNAEKPSIFGTFLPTDSLFPTSR
jgi:hypothetical protein